MEDFLAGFALYLVIEGIMPFASPRRWRESMFYVIRQNDRVLRGVGLASMAAGLLLLFMVRH